MGCLTGNLHSIYPKMNLLSFLLLHFLSPLSLPSFFNLIPPTLGYLLLQRTVLENRHAVMNKAVTIPALVSYMLVRHIQQENYRNNYIKIDLTSVMKESSEFSTVPCKRDGNLTWSGGAGAHRGCQP